MQDYSMTRLPVAQVCALEPIPELMAAIAHLVYLPEQSSPHCKWACALPRCTPSRTMTVSARKLFGIVL